MTPEKILEIARRFDPDEPDFVMTEDSIIAFAQAIIEAERDATTIKVPTVMWDKLKDVNTVSDLIKALQAAEEEK
jgi:hypothetical protein